MVRDMPNLERWSGRDRTHPEVSNAPEGVFPPWTRETAADGIEAALAIVAGPRSEPLRLLPPSKTWWNFGPVSAGKAQGIQTPRGLVKPASLARKLFDVPCLPNTCLLYTSDAADERSS